MDCDKVQETLKSLLDPSKASAVGETHSALAQEHYQTCSNCQTWASKNLCPKMDDETDEDIGMIHIMLLHDESECPNL